MADKESPAKRPRVGGSAASIVAVLFLSVCLSPNRVTGASVPTVSLALDSKCILGESPVWDAKMRRLHFVDINGKKLHSYDPQTSKCSTVEVGEEVGCVVPYRKQRVLIAGVSQVWQVDFAGGKKGETGEGKLLPGQVASVPDSEMEQMENEGEDPTLQPLPGFRFNDGKCDPQGRFLVGTMNKDWRDPAARKGKLFRMVEPLPLKNEEDLDGMVHQFGPFPVLKPIIDDVILSNGMAWGRSEGRDASQPFDIFYFIDSALQTVDRFKFDSETGDLDLSSRVTVVKVPTVEEGGGVPDGMTIDSNGMLWVALGESGSVAQYDPKTGEELMRVKLPVQRPTACTFGGDDLCDLYVTTREEKGESASKNHGGLFRVRIDGVKGMDAAYHYGGQP